MSTNPTPQVQPVTVQDVSTYGADLIVSLSDGTEARHEFPTAMIAGEVVNVDQGGNWLIGEGEKTTERTTDDLLNDVPSFAELFFNLGYTKKYNFEYMDRAAPAWETWSRTHYVYAYDLSEAYRLIHQHKPGATNVNHLSVVKMEPVV